MYVLHHAMLRERNRMNITATDIGTRNVLDGMYIDKPTELYYTIDEYRVIHLITHRVQSCNCIINLYINSIYDFWNFKVY